VFGAELVNTWGAVPIDVVLESGGVSADLLAGRLRAAVARAGFVDAAAAMASAGDDIVGAVDTVLDALASESCAFVIDDAHHAQRDASVLIDRMASRLSEAQFLVVLARNLPAGAERLRRGDAIHLEAADLALRPEETVALCRTGFGLDVSDAEGRLLDDATGGWTAAAVLAASRMKHTGETLQTVATIAASTADRTGPVGSLLDEALTTLISATPQLAQIARLPLLDREILDAVGGEGFFERALAAGLPLTPARDRWWELPGPVREYLATLAPPDGAALRRAAVHYRDRNELSIAMQMLLAAGEPSAIAELLAEADSQQVAEIDVRELLAVVSAVPGKALDNHPFALLHVARSCWAAAMLEERDVYISRALAAARDEHDGALLRALAVERANDLILVATTSAEAERIAHEVLDDASPAEQMTRARALLLLGRARCLRRDTYGRRREADLRTAARYFEEAANLCISVGFRAGVAVMAPYRAIWIHLALGRPLAALDVLNEALGLAGDTPRRYADLLIRRAEVLLELGRHSECESDVDEVLRIVRQLGSSEHLIAFCHWQLMLSNSVRGESEATLEHARKVKAHWGDWWDVAGPDFLADAAESLDRVGYGPLAWEHLEEAKQQPGDAGAMIAMAECALLARHGDPALAEARLGDIHRQGIDLREHWRATLLRAYAAFRRGDAGAGALAARAFEQAAELGQPQLPLVRERDISEQLLGLAVETGQPAALALDASSLPVSLTVLGRFELTKGGRPVGLGSGQAAQLLKLVAVSGGKIVTDQAIDSLWPEAEREAGRNRLRTVLGRLREAAGDVIIREGEVLVLAPDVRFDLVMFQRDTQRARAFGLTDPIPAVALARSAIARYRGELLPHDLYVTWAEAPREAARRAVLDLLDLCAAAAIGRGDLDEVRRVVERTIEIAPYDYERYIKAASDLARLGRNGAALAVVRRARAVLDELGMDAPLPLVKFERSLVA
jgi:DNA-binding SARP family transcriptional activator